MLQLATCVAVNVAEDKYPDGQALVRIEFVSVAQWQHNHIRDALALVDNSEGNRITVGVPGGGYFPFCDSGCLGSVLEQVDDDLLQVPLVRDQGGIRSWPDLNIEAGFESCDTFHKPRDIERRLLRARRAGEDELDDVSASIGGVTPWGSRYSVGVGSVDRRRPFLGSAAGANGTATLRVTQPLLRDFGRDTNYASVRVAEKGLDRSRLGARATIMGTVADAVVAYHNLYFARRNLEIAVTNRDLASQLIANNRRRLQVGSIAAADMTVAETR